MNVYFISGLGADRRAFERIQLPPEFPVHYLDWIAPHKAESLEDYAVRLSKGIDTSKPFALVGLSMGGMIASVLSQKLHPQKTILISSVACVAEFPKLFKFARHVPLYKIVPLWLLREPNLLVHWMFGARSKNEKRLMDYIITNTQPAFVRWAMHAIIRWKQKERPKNLFHIHGSADKILPVKYTKADCIIDRGSHFMVWTRAGEVSKKLAQVLRERKSR